MKGEEKRFIHSFKADVKIPENISNHFSYSLGQVIRPSILIKAPKGQKYLWGGRPEDRTQKGTAKQNKNNPLIFQAFVFCCFFSFFCWCPLGSDAAFDYWCSFHNQPTLVTPVFVLSSTQVEATKPVKGEKIYEYDSLLSILNYLKLSKDQEAHSVSNWYQMPKPWSPFSTLQESFLGPVPVARVLKKVLISMVIGFSCLSSPENQSERGEGRKGRYTDNTQEVAAVINWREEGVCV